MAVSTVAESRGVVVARVMSGSFMTSLEMAGVSLTLMRADQETLRLFGEHAWTSHTFVLHPSAPKPVLKGTVQHFGKYINFFSFQNWQPGSVEAHYTLLV